MDYLNFYKLRKEEEQEIELCSIWEDDFIQEERSFYLCFSWSDKYKINQRRESLEKIFSVKEECSS